MCTHCGTIVVKSGPLIVIASRDRSRKVMKIRRRRVDWRFP